jgi:TonB family protein
MRRRSQKSTPAVQQLLMAGALFALSCGCLLGQKVGLPSSDVLGVQILTPTDGVDFTSFETHLVAAVRLKWFARMPESARMGDKGKVVVRFSIQRDGTLGSQMPTVEESSKKKQIDNAAVQAVRSAAPFDHLPVDFSGPAAEVRLIFVYNLPRDQVTYP